MIGLGIILLVIGLLLVLVNAVRPTPPLSTIGVVLAIGGVICIAIALLVPLGAEVEYDGRAPSVLMQ